MADFTILDLLDLDLKDHNYLELRCLAGRSGLSRKIVNSKISRPGLPLSGYFNEFSSSSIQLFGRGEQMYIKDLEKENKLDTVVKIFSSEIPCCIFCDNSEPSPAILEIAEETSVPLLITPLDSLDFSRRIFSALDEVFAKTETIHGVLVEVFGIGVLITGESGVGKSETALELIERGHRLIADDSVRLKNISDTFLLGSGENPMLAHHMEIRGIGIINLSTIYGVGSIRDKKQVQLSVHLEEWDNDKNYDRVGDNLTDTFLGITIPRVEIPVRPGRNVPILVETAARNERLKKLGIYSAKEFDQSVLQWLESEATKKMYYNSDMDEDTEYAH